MRACKCKLDTGDGLEIWEKENILKKTEQEWSGFQDKKINAELSSNLKKFFLEDAGILQNDNGLSLIDQNEKIAGEKTRMVETSFCNC